MLPWNHLSGSPTELEELTFWQGSFLSVYATLAFPESQPTPLKPDSWPAYDGTQASVRVAPPTSPYFLGNVAVRQADGNLTKVLALVRAA
jgi:hypothetical protein